MIINDLVKPLVVEGPKEAEARLWVYANCCSAIVPAYMQLRRNICSCLSRAIHIHIPSINQGRGGPARAHNIDISPSLSSEESHSSES